MVRVLLVALIFAVSVYAQAPAERPSPLNGTEQPKEDDAFGDAEGAAVLRAFANGLENHDLTRFLATFDENAYPGFSVFAGEMDSYFGRYDEFRVHYLLKQTTIDEHGRGVLLAQMQLEETPVGAGESTRHSADVRFELVRSDGKWKVAAFTPREFLS